MTEPSLLDSLTRMIRDVGMPKDPDQQPEPTPDDRLLFLDSLVGLTPDDPELRVERAEVRLENGHLDGALEDVDFVLAQDPEFLDARLVRAHTLAALERYEDSLADAERVLTVRTEDVGALQTRAQCHFVMRADEKAMADLDRLVALGAQDPWVYSSRGAMHLFGGRKTEALADVDFAASLAADSPIGPYDRAWMRARARMELDEGRAAAAEARARGYDPYAVDMALGYIELAAHRAAEALTAFDASLADNPESTESLYGRGLALIALGRKAEGEADVRQAEDDYLEAVDYMRDYGFTS